MTTQTIETQLQNELNLAVSETLPGQAFIFFDLLNRWRNLGYVSGLENHTNADFKKLDEKFRLDVYSDKYPGMWHIGYDFDGNNIYEKVAPNPETNTNQSQIELPTTPPNGTSNVAWLLRWGTKPKTTNTVL